MKNLFVSIFLTIILLPCFSQIPLGTWRSHMPFSEASDVAAADNKIYCSTSGGLFYFNTRDNSINILAKENGLSDAQVSCIEYSASSQILVVAYRSGNLDLILKNSIYNIPDIKNKVIPGDKSIYNISVSDNGLAYLSCGFGIVVLNLAKREVSETYLIGPGGSQIKVNDVCLDEENIYAATDIGVFFAPLSSNLPDYHSWNRDRRIPNYDKKFNTITYSGNRIYTNFSSGINNGDTVYYLEGNAWTRFSQFNDDICNELKSWNNNLVVVRYFHVDIFNPQGTNITHVYFGQPKRAVAADDGTLWAADAVGGLIRYRPGSDLLKISPGGPAHIFVSSIRSADNRIYAVPGGMDAGQGNLYRTAEVYILESGTWTNWSSDTVRDFHKIAIDPVNPDRYFVASWGYGLFEFENGVLKNTFRDNNSTLQTIIPGDMFYRIGGLTFDMNRNLWVTNSGVSQPLSVLKSNGEWISYSLNSMINSNMGDIIETSSGLKWIILMSGRGLFVIDDNQTIDNPDDDQYKRIDIVDENNRIITNEVYAIIEDKDHILWIGTNKGILVYDNPGRVFEPGLFYAGPIIVPRNDGTGDILLGNETVTCIAIDGANRKWIGTRNAGAFLVSADGVKQIRNFNTDNSPLLSNSIISISINEKTGEVFFGTEQGIVSFKGDATEPSGEFSNVYVYPNPVTGEFSGNIVISGLVEDTHVKITDISGNLVYETISMGGQALWDGKNFNGDRVSTGVYLVFCSNRDGTMTHVTKLLFIH